MYITAETRRIIKECNLSKGFIDKLKRDFRYKDGYYIKTTADDRMNIAIKDWYTQRNKNRQRLLHDTPYGYLYSNRDSMV